MGYSIDMIENGYIVTMSDVTKGWSAEPQRWSFNNWDDMIAYLNKNKLVKENKEVVA